MRKLSTFLILTLSICGFHACKSNNPDEHADHNHNHAVHNHSKHESEHEDHDGDEASDHESDEIQLSKQNAERFGVTTETVAAAPFADALKVSGEIIQSPTDAAVIVAPTSGVLTFNRNIDLGSHVAAGSAIAKISATGVSGGDPNLAAKAALDAAKRELDRLQPLYDDRLVTASEYNAALRAYEEAKAGYSSSASSGVVKAPISGIITTLETSQGQYVEVGQQIATVSASSRLTLRADVPQRYFNRIQSFTDALVKLPYSQEAVMLGDIDGKRISSENGLASPTPGYVPVYFSFENNGNFIPGSSIDVYLQSNKSENIISVPLSAISEQQGLYYVFAKIDDECYRKIPVKTGRNNGERVEIKSGLTPGDNIVVTGTTTVRIAESSGNIPEGHSHNH